MKKIFYFFLISVIFLLHGCTRPDKDITEEILKKDPAFEKMLNAKKHINIKVDNLKSGYENEKEKTINAINDLKNSLKIKKDELNTKISSLEKEISPKVEKLKKRLEEKTEEFTLAKKESRDTLSKMANVKKLLNKKGDLGLSGDEVAIWDKRIVSLEEEINTTYKNLDKLRSEIRILSAEIKILEE
ncbi:MAG: hypothetical protein ABIH57_00595 [Candidatus Omnitrophota bacterium]